jgi:hypothetical protein
LWFKSIFRTIIVISNISINNEICLIFFLNRYLIDTFVEAKCWEWVFLLGLVLKRFSIINEIMRMILTNELPPNMVDNLKKGINDLSVWSQNEW